MNDYIQYQSSKAVQYEISVLSNGHSQNFGLSNEKLYLAKSGALSYLPEIWIHVLKNKALGKHTCGKQIGSSEFFPME